MLINNDNQAYMLSKGKKPSDAAIGNSDDLCGITKINKFLSFGSVDHSVHLTEQFKSLKIDVVIDCMGTTYYSLQPSFVIHKFSFLDDVNATLSDQIDEVDTLIFDLLGKGKRIYIQCHDGNSISPAIVIYYLMMHKECSFENALSALVALRPTVMLNDYFYNELTTIEEVSNLNLN